MIVELRNWSIDFVKLGDNRCTDHCPDRCRSNPQADACGIRRVFRGIPNGHPIIADGEPMRTSPLRFILGRLGATDLRRFQLVGPPAAEWLDALARSGLHYDPENPAFPRPLE